MVFGTAIICILSFLVSFLYFYYCLKIADMFSSKEKEPNEIKERVLINKRVIYN